MKLTPEEREQKEFAIWYLGHWNREVLREKTDEEIIKIHQDVIMKYGENPK